MYKGIGVNMNKQYKNLRKKNKHFVHPSSYKNNFSNMRNEYYDSNDYDCKSNNTGNYSFYDSIEDMEDCMNSDDPNCKVRSCLLDREIEVNKKVILASCIGAIAGVIGVTCAIKKMDKPQNKMLKSAPCLMKMAKKFF